jgi:CRP/FNR family cyclic AMP-dependent transcriptional regulator
VLLMNDPTKARVGEFLRQGEWFGSLPADLQDGVLGHASIRTYAKGQVIQVEDSAPAAGLVAVLDGGILMLRYVADHADPALIHVAGPGFWFGEMIVLDGGLPAVTIVAQTDVKALVLPTAEFHRLRAADPRYFEAVATIALQRTRVLLRSLAEARKASPDERLRLRLADLAELRRLDLTLAGPHVDLPISQAELGRIVGLSRQKVNARLQQLQHQGWIELRQRHIRVRDPRGLRASIDGSTSGRQSA